jgi:tRNA-uridine 2-sulfurtransferase
VSEVLVAMSGGVDSSVAAALLLDAGHTVTGVTLRLWGGETDSGCCSVSDVEDARRVAAQLGISHYVFNLADTFMESVVDPYVAAHSVGNTPNPCVECNRSIKFGVLFERAVTMGFSALATGHHARVSQSPNGEWQLLRGVDDAKDQSYVLYMLDQTHLARTLLPVGEMTKAEVRSEATRLGLRTATKPESMDVCFVRREDRGDFLAARAPARPGVVQEIDGTVVARHEALAGFTVGQRKGLGVAQGEPRYVIAVDGPSATVTIGTQVDLLTPTLALRDMTFVAEAAPSHSEELSVQTRAHGSLGRGRIEMGELGSAEVLLCQPLARVASGQVVALYRGDELVGGGIVA